MKHRRGFTLVELLIVMVVVGILAAISILAYNGLADKANDAKKVADVEMMKKQLDLYLTKHQTLPFGPGDTSMITTTQHRWDEPVPNGFNTCWQTLGNYRGGYNQGRLDTFTGCNAYERGHLYRWSQKYYGDHVDGGFHTPEDSLSAGIGQLYLSNTSNDNEKRLWRTFFQKVPNIANILPPPDGTRYMVHIWLSSPNNSTRNNRYCYYVVAETRFVGEQRSSWSPYKEYTQDACHGDIQINVKIR